MCVSSEWSFHREQPQQSAPKASANLCPNGYGPCKWLFDVVLAMAILIVTAPLLLLAALCVKLTSPGPAIYSQVRLGRGGRPFRIYKLRTMRHDCEKHSGARWSTPGDSRVTALGRFLRKTHIDEFPQLWNVLRGEMSLVGPRPERPEFIPKLEETLNRYRERLLVRPGLSGLAQIQLPPDTDLESVRRKLAHDLCYVQEMSWWLDCRIMLCTALSLLGLPTGGPARCLALPGGTVVEQAYRESLVRRIPDGEQARAGVTVEPAVADLPRDPLAPELQPA
jgi:lipopolysaccharide/colanic/teichoic acid biosynthesis glycosyltransferase